MNICSDTIADFIYECNTKTHGEVIGRIARLYPCIFIDEVQDLAGYELEILRKLFDSSSNILLLGDLRQIVYLTHHSAKNKDKQSLTIKGYIEKNKLEQVCP